MKINDTTLKCVEEQLENSLCCSQLLLQEAESYAWAFFSFLNKSFNFFLVLTKYFY